MINKIKHYRKNGFVILRNLLNEKQVKILIKEIDVIKSKAIKTKNKRYFHLTTDGSINTIHNIQKFCKSKILKNLADDKKILQILRLILSKNIKVRNLEFFLKPKKTGMASPIHQDNFFWNIDDSKAANVWIALSKANKNNGGIFYYMKSHTAGIFKHVPSLMKGTSQKIPNKEISGRKFKKIYPNLKAGDCLIHHCEIVHGSNKNLSNSNRIGIAISYKNKYSKINLLKKRLYEKRLKENLKKIYY